GGAARDGGKGGSRESGGKSPVIVLDDGEAEVAAQGAAAAIFFSQGQVCTAGSRLYVQKGSYAKVVERSADSAAGMRSGSGFAPDTQVGPSVSARHQQRVMDYIGIGRAEGGKVSAGGAAGEGAGYFVRPTVFTDSPQDARMAREEIFGPVSSIIGYKDEEDAVRIANDTVYGLAGYVSSGDVERARRVARRIRAGNVN
ncbi:hypothetical protein OY671_009656, partial [Metschnikowia pulcherrima]